MSISSPTTRPVVVTGSDDATVRVWDLDARGLLHQPLEAHRGKVNAVAVGKLGGRPIAISGGNDRTVRMWDLEAGGPLGGPLVHDRFVNAVAVGALRDRSLSAFSDGDETVRPVVAAALADPGREAAMTLGSRRMEQGGSPGSAGSSPSASRRQDRRAAPAGGLGAVSMKRRSQVGRSVTSGRRARSVTGLELALIGLMLLGVVLVGFGFKMLADTRRFLATAEPAKGVVVRVDKRVRRERVGSGDNEHWADVTRYFPIVEFRTARGQVAQFQADEARSGSATRSGLSTTPGNPRNARLDKWGNRWAGPLAFWGAGLAILVMTGATYLLLGPWGRAARA